MGYANLGELQRALETARVTWVPRIMFVLVPFFAGLVALLERRVGRRYPAHLVFALHVHAAGFAARAVAALAAIPVPGWAEPLSQTASLYTVVYMFMALRKAYGASRSRATLETAVIALIYVIVMIVALAAVFSLAMFGPRWPGAIGR
jgi:hypothetical protein